ncbi:MAG: hypothetical protein JNK34_09925 [Tabrizicola sp.]|nr:hypothetical protein [Tabrizicola sp.]
MGPRADALNAAIAEAWRVFDIPAPATTGVCEHCCMDPQIEADFLTRKARELPPEYVRDWYFAAFDDEIGHDHVAWLLPRVMELLAKGETVAVVGNEVVFQRLPLTDYPGLWPKEEVAAVQGFAEAFFAAQLGAELPPLPEGLDGCLCMFGEGGIDLQPLLRQLEALSDDALIALLHKDWVLPYGRCIAGSAFWHDGPARNLVWDWYTSKNLLDRLGNNARAGDRKAVDLCDLILAAQDE